MPLPGLTPQISSPQPVPSLTKLPGSYTENNISLTSYFIDM